MTLIKDAFVGVLSGMYHHRIDYPPLPRNRAEAKQGVAPDRETTPSGAGSGRL
jgi:hypothetical protein